MALTFRSDNWFTKAGKPRRVDLLNLTKVLEDEVTRALGYDDSHNWKIVLLKDTLREKGDVEHVSILIAAL